MNTAIVYSSTHGTTEKTAHQIQELLGKKNIDLYNLKTVTTIDLSLYDKIIIGGSIHAGNIQLGIKKFCNQNTVELLQKKLGLFLCCMNEDAHTKQFHAAYPEILRNHAIASCIAGGEFLFEKMNFFQKLIVKKVSGFKTTVSKINNDAIEEFVLQLQHEKK